MDNNNTQFSDWLTEVYVTSMDEDTKKWLVEVYTKALLMAELSEGFDFSDQDYQYLAKHTEELYKRGYTKDDAVRYLYVTEEVDPDLDEDVALARMKRISDKYTRADRREITSVAE
jgi:hypothetical protein